MSQNAARPRAPAIMGGAVAAGAKFLELPPPPPVGVDIVSGVALGWEKLELLEVDDVGLGLGADVELVAGVELDEDAGLAIDAPIVSVIVVVPTTL